MTARGLIFDFDGVIADSEVLANAVLAEAVSDLGHPTTVEDSVNRYMGRRLSDVIALVESEIGRPVPDHFANDLSAATLQRLRSDLQEVKGARNFIRHFADVPKSIASSSSLDRLQLCLGVLGLAEAFGASIFSADMVDRGKPHPDIYLLAARQMGVSPEHCIVIEDGVSGVRAGVAAGMTVLGLCAGSHLRSGHAQQLIDAGAVHIADSWSEARELVSSLLQPPSRLQMD
jgi:HAD superfamily hydrolase (TIGR01509 family)